ncbi:hypothetical protein ACNQFZ_03860 [Schinkia sp. CFF1]
MMKTIDPLLVNSRTTLYVTNTKPIIGLPHGAKIPDGMVLENRHEKIAYDVSGLYLVDYTVGNEWCEGSVVVAKVE